MSGNLPSKDRKMYNDLRARVDRNWSAFRDIVGTDDLPQSAWKHLLETLIIEEPVRDNIGGVIQAIRNMGEYEMSIVAQLAHNAILEVLVQFAAKSDFGGDDD